MAEKFEMLEEQFPDIFRDWHITREIGRGSYGAVYEVQKSSGGITDKAALKHVSFPKDQYDLQAICSEIGTTDEAAVRDYIFQSVQEYRGEYQIMRDLKGMTNIVSCEDFQVLEKSDMPGYDIFIRMELLEAVSTVMTRQKFDRDEVIRLGMDICRALQLLEKKNILHRDIKPENIFRNANGDYKLGDFGSARTMTGTRAIVTAKGTPAYMAPEILLLKEAGPFTDIYSLGLVMFRLMNENRSPFLEAGLSSTTMSREAAASRRVSGEKLPKPVNADEGLARVILKACEFKPEDRYQTADEMYDDLSELLSESKKAAPASSKKEKKTEDREEKKPRESSSLAFEGTQLGRKNVLSKEEMEAIKKAEEERIRKEKEAEERKKKEAEEAKKAKAKKTLIAVICSVAALIVIGVAALLISNSMKKKAAYTAAVAKIEENDLEGAQAALAEFEDTYEETAAKKEEVAEALKVRDNARNAAKRNIDRGENLQDAINSLKSIKKQYPQEKQGEINDLISRAEHLQQVQEAQALASSDPEQAAVMLDELKEGELAAAVRKAAAYASALTMIRDNDLEGAQAALEQFEDTYEETLLKKEEVAEALKNRDKAFSTAKRNYERGENLQDAINSLQEIRKLYPQAKQEEITELIGKAEHLQQVQEAQALAETDPEQAAKILQEQLHEDALAEKVRNEQQYQIALVYLANDATITQGIDKLNELIGKEYRILDCQKQIKAGQARQEYLGAMELLGKGEYVLAADKFKALTQNEADTSDAAIREKEARARDFLDKQKYKEAKDLLAQVETADETIIQLAAQAEVGIKQSADFNEGLKMITEAERQYGFATGEVQTMLQYYKDSQDGYKSAREIFEKLADNGFSLNGDSAAARAADCGRWVDYLEGRMLLLRGSYPQARGYFNQLLAAGFLDAEDQIRQTNLAETLQKAEEAFAREDLDGARELYQQLEQYQGTSEMNEGLAKVAEAEELRNKYNQAIASMENKGSYEEAKRLLQELAGQKYKDASERLEDLETLMDRGATYTRAIALEENQDYARALTLFETLATENYEDSAKHATFCQQNIDYEEAVRNIDAGDLSTAKRALTRLGNEGFAKAEERLGEISVYEDASNKQSNGLYAEAKNAFESLGRFYNAQVRAEECKKELDYQRAVSIMETEPEAAAAIFEALGSMYDSQTNLAACRNAISYKAGVAAMESGDYAGALNIFSQLGNYSDSTQRASECSKIMQYDSAMSYKEQGNYERANESFVSLGNFRDSQAQARICQFELFCAEVSNGGDVYKITRNAYQYIFDQDIELSNKKNWAKVIPAANPTGAELAVGFAFAPQFRDKDISNEQRVKELCDVLLNRRGSDDPSVAEYGTYADSLKYVEYLDNGASMYYVLDKLIQDEDFVKLCKNDGIAVGTIDLTEVRDQNYETTCFITHCYHTVLDRTPSPDDLNHYGTMIRDKELTEEALMNIFVNSEEFINRGLENGDFVQVLYRLMLGREASDGERDYNVNLLASNALSRAALAETLTYSGECQEYLIRYRTYILQYKISESLDEFVTTYAAGRPVNIFAYNAFEFIYSEPRTLAPVKREWAASLRLGGTVYDLVSSFVSYPAYSAPEISNAGRVSSMFQIMLNRRVDPNTDPGSAGFLNAMDIGMSSWYLINTIAGSEEFANLYQSQGVDPGIFATVPEPRDANYTLTALVDQLYREGLGRAASPEEFNDWCGKYLGGMISVPDLMITILTSAEARNHLPENVDYVKLLYRIALHRDADEGGLQMMLNMMEQGSSRAEIAATIFSSPEFQAIWVPTGLVAPIE